MSTPTRPADQEECPGCGELVHFKTIACALCWRAVPGELKARFSQTAAGSGARSRVIAEMRQWLRERPGLTA